LGCAAPRKTSKTKHDGGIQTGEGVTRNQTISLHEKQREEMHKAPHPPSGSRGGIE